MTLRLALAQWRIERPAGVAGWLARLDREVATAVAAGAELLVLPEYAAMEAAAGEAPDLAAELARAMEHSAEILDGARAIATRHGAWLIPGSWPFATPAGPVNRAPLLAPDGAVRFQDKHVMTRFETERWGILPGEPPSVFDTPWGRIGIAVCFDVEFPILVRAQVAAGAWLVLVPACTDTMHGFHRVRAAIAARALEGQCFCAMAPTVGQAPWSGSLDRNTGRAAVCGPIDLGFPADGIMVEGRLDEPGWVHCALDPARLESVRRDGAVRNVACWPADPPPCPVR